MTEHGIDPVYDADSRVLILGSFPSVASREVGFFYGHRQNRFWRVMSIVTGEKLPETINEKKALLINNGIALWDVISSCDIEGSADSSIRNVSANDLSPIFTAARIQKVFCNGKKAQALYDKYLLPVWGIQSVCLPSTSPANAAYSLERLASEWKQITLLPED